jgi:LPS-assembly protein
VSAPRRRWAPRRAAPFLAAAVALCGLLLLRESWAQIADVGGLLGSSQSAQSSQEPVFIDADKMTYDKPNDTVKATGDVVVTHGTSVLTADSVELNRKQSEADAEGSVVLEDPQARIRASHAWFEMEDETGFLEDGQLYFPQSRFQLGGAKLEKGIGQTYHIWDGHMTTCQCEDGVPDWSITGEEVNLKVEGNGTVRDGWFRIKDYPVLYLPYGAFPIRRERQSGFLFPRFGISNRRGFQWVQPYYWAINKTSDATVSFDAETAARLGVTGEYRYMLAPNAGGILTASYFNEHIGNATEADKISDPEIYANPTVHENRGSIIGDVEQPGPFGSRLYAKPFLVSDNLFLKNINTFPYLPAGGFFTSTRFNTKSSAGIVKVWNWGLFQGDASYYQELISKQSREPQPLPRLDFSVRQSVFNHQLRLALDTEAVEYWRAPLASGPRLDIAPQATLPFRLGEYGFGQAQVVLRETAYYLTSNEIPQFPQPTPTGGLPPGPTPTPNPSAPLATRAVDKTQHREILVASWQLQSEVSRVFPLGVYGIEKLKHTIEPFVKYLYAPHVNQDDLPIYDATDRINARNLITYGIGSRLLGKLGSGSGLALAAAPPVDVPTSSQFPTAGLGSLSGGPLEPGGAPYGIGTGGAIPEPAYSGPSPPSIAADQSARIQELARFSIQQSYSLSDPIVVVNNERQYLSGIDAFLRLSPVSFFNFQGQLTYSTIDHRLAAATAGVNIVDPRPIAGPEDLFLTGLRPVNSASFFYQFNPNGALENINLTTTYRLTNNLSLAYLGRYDAVQSQFLENWFGFRAISSCDCWVIDFAFVDHSNPPEKEYRVLFSLVGLGSFGQQPPFGRPVAGFNRGPGLAPGSGFGGVY